MKITKMFAALAILSAVSAYASETCLLNGTMSKGIRIECTEKSFINRIDIERKLFVIAKDMQDQGYELRTSVPSGYSEKGTLDLIFQTIFVKP